MSLQVLMKPNVFLPKAESFFGATRDPRLVPLRADSLYVLLLPFLGGHFW
jgi:hypothetical protein